jgi:hypothetical protein
LPATRIRISWEDRTLSGGLDDWKIIESVLETEIPKSHVQMFR